MTLPWPHFLASCWQARNELNVEVPIHILTMLCQTGGVPQDAHGGTWGVEARAHTAVLGSVVDALRGGGAGRSRDDGDGALLARPRRGRAELQRGILLVESPPRTTPKWDRRVPTPLSRLLPVPCCRDVVRQHLTKPNKTSCGPAIAHIGAHGLAGPRR